jgi:Cof subfamily protein (haloacid dehalogenase superfamily)
MKTAFRMIALDMDGTLLNSQRALSERNRAALALAQEAGWIICLASGRSISAMRFAWEAAGLTGPIVSCNGAYVEDGSGRIIQSRTLGLETVETAIGLGMREGLHCNVYVRDEILMSSDEPFGAAYRRLTGLSSIPAVGYDGLLGRSANKVVFMGDPGRIDEAEAGLRSSQWPERIEIVRSESQYVEVLPPQINKSEGVAAAAADLGFGMDQVAAIGDYLNDLELISQAGWGGAVANAHPDILAVAQWIGPSNDDGGAAEFIEVVMNLAQKSPRSEQPEPDAE